jgi:hypothetical protein
MKAKLELKDLVSYLPYNLKSIDYFDGNKLIRDITLFNVANFFDETTNAKPLLRPLSDLTKEIEHNGEKFVPIDRLWNETLEQVDNATYDDHFFSSDLKTTWISPDNVLQLEYIVVEKLIEWHFDVFGLIEKGLAVPLT